MHNGAMRDACEHTHRNIKRPIQLRGPLHDIREPYFPECTQQASKLSSANQHPVVPCKNGKQPDSGKPGSYMSLKCRDSFWLQPPVKKCASHGQEPQMI
eukprot:3712514-Amphidinium_carterae.2